MTEDMDLLRNHVMGALELDRPAAADALDRYVKHLVRETLAELKAEEEQRRLAEEEIRDAS